MLLTLAVVLFALWLIGMVTANLLGGFIHLLLLFAVILVLIRLIQGKQLA